MAGQIVNDPKRYVAEKFPFSQLQTFQGRGQPEPRLIIDPSVKENVQPGLLQIHFRMTRALGGHLLSSRPSASPEAWLPGRKWPTVFCKHACTWSAAMRLPQCHGQGKFLKWAVELSMNVVARNCVPRGISWPSLLKRTTGKGVFVQ